MAHEPEPPLELVTLAGEDWTELAAAPELLVAFRAITLHNRQVARGERPPGWTRAATCRHCGPIWLWPSAPEQVAGCPWCHPAEGRVSFPRPAAVTCRNCRHFEPDTISPRAGMGGCRAGMVAGCWPGQRSGCAGYWMDRKGSKVTKPKSGGN